MILESGSVKLRCALSLGTAVAAASAAACSHRSTTSPSSGSSPPRLALRRCLARAVSTAPVVWQPTPRHPSNLAVTDPGS